MRNSLPLGKSVLLDMLSTARHVSEQSVTQLSDQDWTAIARIIKQHRLGPILEHRCRTRGSKWRVPESIRSAWQYDLRRSQLRTIKLQATLIQITKCLSVAGIEFVVLKGGWLAWHAYPQQSLRPMRDIDIWVDPELAIPARAALLSAGFESGAVDNKSMEHALHHAKHLPLIKSSMHRINVEVHSRVFHEINNFAKPHVKGYSVGLAKRKITQPFDNFSISYLSPTDTLIHVIVHWVYDHHFNNGPVVLDDIAYLLAAHEIEWLYFWQIASEQRWSKGCILALNLVEHQHGKQPVIWPPNIEMSVPLAMVERSLELCMQDFDTRGPIAFYGDFLATPTLRSLLLKIKRRFSVPRTQLAALIGVSPHSPLIWLGYPLWLVGVAHKASQWLFSRTVRSNAKRYGDVSEWLAAERRCSTCEAKQKGERGG